MVAIFKDKASLMQGIHGIVEILPEENEVFVLNKERLWADDIIDDLVYTAVFSPSGEVQRLVYRVVREVGEQVGVYPASIQSLYEQMGRGKVSGFTVPALNLRGPTYDEARAAIRAQRALNAGPVIFELAKSEMGYTNQSPQEYATCVLAAAIKEQQGEEGYGPIFIQGDHFQVNASKFHQDREPEIRAMQRLIDQAIQAGFYNIDIDTSTLVDLSGQTIDAQQEDNYTVSAGLIQYIRSKSPEGLTISVGGEIGEVGSQNSTPEELRAYMKGLRKALEERVETEEDNGPADDIPGPSKISVQTGTTHGGVPAPDGTIKEVNLDFDTLKTLSDIAREEYGMAGAVQHGASTLPDDLFHKFPEVGTAEIHLATGFQNLIMDHKRFPKKLRERMYDYLKQHHSQERKEGWTEQQFFYKLRKKAHAPFKWQLWDLNEDAKTAIMNDLQGKFEFLYKQLGIVRRQTEITSVLAETESDVQAD